MPVLACNALRLLVLRRIQAAQTTEVKHRLLLSQPLRLSRSAAGGEPEPGAHGAEKAIKRSGITVARWRGALDRLRLQRIVPVARDEMYVQLRHKFTDSGDAELIAASEVLERTRGLDDFAHQSDGFFAEIGNLQRAGDRGTSVIHG